MRCIDCQKAPVAGHHCECCGRPLSLKERRAETPLVGGDEPERPAPQASSTSGGRCRSCGGPATDGNLCRWCQRTFGYGDVRDTPKPVSQKPAVVQAATTPVDGTAPPPPAPMAASVVSSQATAAERKPEPAKRATSSSADPYFTWTDPYAKTSKRTNPSAPRQSNRRKRRIMFASAALALGAIVLLAERQRIQGNPAIASEQTQAPDASSATADAARRSTTEASAAANEAPKNEPPSTPAPRASKAAAAGDASRWQTALRRAGLSAQVARASSSTPSPATNFANAPATSSTPDSAASIPGSAQTATAAGPLFETSDVSEAPHVTMRIEPDLPDALRSRVLNEVVVVRLLVSQTGRPSRVSVLRGSKVSAQVDSAVVAAVNQWTFAPARKRGEAVTSWFNVGVPVARIE